MDEPDATRLSRRKALVGGLGIAAVGGAFTAQQMGVAQRARPILTGLLGTCGDDPGLPDTADTKLVRGTIPAEYLDADSEWIVSYPVGMAEKSMPLIVVLHGAQGHADHAFDENHGLGRFQNQVVEATGRPFALALVDGFRTLWFDGGDGRRARSLITEGLFPAVEDLGLSTERLALYGWGTGGFGVLGLAQDLGAERVAAIGSLSPAIFPTWDFVEGYYRDEAEWSAHDPHQSIDELTTFPLRVDCGTEDPFADEVMAFRSAFDPELPGAVDHGCRDFRYWHQRHPLMLEFLAKHLV